METKLKFRLVFEKNINMYQLQYTDTYGDWIAQDNVHILTKNGEPKKTINSGFGLISERLLWYMNYLIFLGYEFIGIEEE